MNYYVGIDGGGTSCRARIRNQQGEWVGEAKSGSANIMLGVEVALCSVVDAITQAAEQGGLSPDDFPRMHVGLALAGAEQKRRGTLLCSKRTLSLPSRLTPMLMALVLARTLVKRARS